MGGDLARRLRFSEQFISPIPAETLLIPLCLARPERCWRYAGIATGAAVLGGLVGYAIGAAALASIGAPIIAFYGADEAFGTATERFNEAGLQWILLATITPMPYKVVTITSGVSGMSLPLFLTASILGRFIGYFLIALIVRQFGAAALRSLKTPAARLAALLALLICGYLLIV